MNRRQQLQSQGKQIELEHSWAADQWDWPLQGHDGIVRVENTDDHFEVALETKYFTPKEIDVRVINRDLNVFCHHEKDDKLGGIAREVMRTYKLPEDVDVDTLRSNLRPDGILQINASKRRGQ